jgi:hypothetical protein
MDVERDFEIMISPDMHDINLEDSDTIYALNGAAMLRYARNFFCKGGRWNIDSAYLSLLLPCCANVRNNFLAYVGVSRELEASHLYAIYIH